MDLKEYTNFQNKGSFFWDLATRHQVLKLNFFLNISLKMNWPLATFELDLQFIS